MWRDGALEPFARTLGVGAGLPVVAVREDGAATLEDLCHPRTGAAQ